MRLSNILKKVADLLASGAEDYQCGNCPRFHRCGLAPDADCPVRLQAQAAGDRWSRPDRVSFSSLDALRG